MSQNGSPTPAVPPPPAPLDAHEFYIGYVPRAPRRLARHTMIVAGAHVLFAAACATIGVAFFFDPGPGVWEYGQFRTFEGLLRTRPYPVIELSEPLGGPGGARTALVVDFGKHGAQAKGAAFDNHPVRITGSLLQRDGRTLIELAPQSDPIAHLEHPFDQIIPDPVSRGTVTLRGEIVDPKCFMGAMKPGEGKTHKACAVRCISGGIPPVLVTWDGRGGSTYYVLTGRDGGPVNDGVLPLVGEPVELTGDLYQRGDLLFLAIDPAAVVRP